MTPPDNLRRLAAPIRKVLRVHDGSEFTADEYPTLTEAREATAALDALEADLEIRERQVAYLLREQERGRILAAAVEQRERKVERLIAAQGKYRKLAADLINRHVPVGEADDWLAQAFELTQAVADLQADSPPPIAREGMVTVYGAKGEYLGCMGRERWERLLSEDTPPIARDPVQDAPRRFWT